MVFVHECETGVPQIMIYRQNALQYSALNRTTNFKKKITEWYAGPHSLETLSRSNWSIREARLGVLRITHWVHPFTFIPLLFSFPLPFRCSFPLLAPYHQSNYALCFFVIHALHALCTADMPTPVHGQESSTCWSSTLRRRRTKESLGAVNSPSGSGRNARERMVESGNRHNSHTLVNTGQLLWNKENYDVDRFICFIYLYLF